MVSSKKKSTAIPLAPKKAASVAPKAPKKAFSVKPKPKKQEINIHTIKEFVLNSSIAKRVSPTTIDLAARANPKDFEQFYFIILNDLTPSLKFCPLSEQEELLCDMVKLIRMKI